jgi:two-component system response regulator AtoC
MNRVLVVDDDAGMRAALEIGFRRRGWSVESAAGTEEALGKLNRQRPALVVTDIRMPDGDGFAVMRAAQTSSPRIAVILLTAFASVPEAVEAMKSGACDYLVKPIPFERIEQAAARILRSAALSETGPEMVGHSPNWLESLERARQASASDADILIEAESGTGKELLARMIHRASARRQHPLVAVNCSAFPDTLLESELFGHARGAFTGAISDRAGKFELANHGTLLLDEIGEMPLSLQPKLLRVLQEREVDRLGGTRSLKLDVRVISTTNRSLQQLTREGKFRSDLYYRLNVIPLSIPPLRERREDISFLARHFLRVYAPGGPYFFTPELLQHLENYDWPGNVRELSNLVRRAIALASGPEIGMAALPEVAGPPGNTDRLEPGLSLVHVERRLFEMTLAATGGNRSRAAEMLGVSLRTVRNKIRDYNLPPRRSYAHE